MSASTLKPHEHTAATDLMIDAMGGVVILVALLSAYTGKYAHLIGHAGALPIRADLGFLSLQMFLALAAYHLLRELSAGGDWAAYLVARAVRFTPAVVPAVLLSYILVTGAGMPQLHADVTALLANLTMMADFVGAPDFDGAFWRLKIEVMFALCLGLAWFGLGGKRALAVLGIGLVACACQAHGEPVHQPVLTATGLLTMDGYLPNLAFGMAVFHLPRRRHVAFWLALALVSIALVVASNTLLHTAWVLGAYAAIALAAHGALPLLPGLPGLAALGRIFFPVYVVHQALGFVVIHRLEAHGVPALAAVGVAACAAILCGAVIHRTCTRPAQIHAPRLLANVGRLVGVEGFAGESVA